MAEMVIGNRQVRAIALIAGAMVAAAAVSFVDLRPPAPPVTRAPKAPAAAPFVDPLMLQHIDLTRPADGGYFFWNLPGTGSGGRAS
jgi:hypothetical protein